MELSAEETKALVAAMRARVERVVLYNVTLDIEELSQFDGQGRCSWLRVYYNTRVRHGDRLRKWTADKGWRVTHDSDGELEMERK